MNKRRTVVRGGKKANAQGGALLWEDNSASIICFKECTFYNKNSAFYQKKIKTN